MALLILVFLIHCHRKWLSHQPRGSSLFAPLYSWKKVAGDGTRLSARPFCFALGVAGQQCWMEAVPPATIELVWYSLSWLSISIRCVHGDRLWICHKVCFYSGFRISCATQYSVPRLVYQLLTMTRGWLATKLSHLMRDENKIVFKATAHLYYQSAVIIWGCPRRVPASRDNGFSVFTVSIV